MLRGIYTAASGMNAEVLEQDTVANNIANATTLGFKKDTPVFEAFPNRLLQRIRVAEKEPGVTRVVLDVAAAATVSTSRLVNPDRLMIELRSEAAAPVPAA